MYEQTIVILFRYHGAAHPQVSTIYRQSARCSLKCPLFF